MTSRPRPRDAGPTPFAPASRRRAASPLALLLTVLAAALAFAFAAPARPALAEAPAAAGATNPAPIVHADRWYQVLLSNAPSGWMHARVVERPGPTPAILSTTRIELSVRRDTAVVKMILATSFEETPDGKPLRAWVSQRFSTETTEQTYDFTGPQVTLTTRSRDLERTQSFPRLELPAPAPAAASSPATPAPATPWLTPFAADRLLKEQLAAGAPLVRYFTFDPVAGPRLHEVIWKRLGPENVAVLGKTVPAIAWEQSDSIAPEIATRTHLDAQGQMVRTSVAFLPGLSLVFIQADEKLARANVNPPDLIARTLIRPDRPIPNARALRQGVYEVLYHANGALADATGPAQPPGPPATGPAAPSATILPDLDLPQTGSQRVSRLPPPRLGWRVEVDAAAGEAARPGPPPATQPQYSGASPLINPHDAKVRELAERALNATLPDAPPPQAASAPATAAATPAPTFVALSDESPAAIAEKLRRFVHRYITAKDLSVAMATAGEVARTAEGDCTEHAVLLAALLRAVGIPARTASGLIYVDSFAGQRGGILGYHMWTQAWLAEGAGRGRWVDLDATLPNAHPFDAAHIALSTSALHDAAPGAMIDFASLFGRLSVRVIEPPAPAGPDAP